MSERGKDEGKKWTGEKVARPNFGRTEGVDKVLIERRRVQSIMASLLSSTESDPENPYIQRQEQHHAHWSIQELEGSIGTFRMQDRYSLAEKALWFGRARVLRRKYREERHKNLEGLRAEGVDVLGLASVLYIARERLRLLQPKHKGAGPAYTLAAVEGNERDLKEHIKLDSLARYITTSSSEKWDQAPAYFHAVGRRFVAEMEALDLTDEEIPNLSSLKKFFEESPEKD